MFSPPLSSYTEGMTFDPTSQDDDELLTDDDKAVDDSEANEDAAESSTISSEKASPAARKLEPLILAHVSGPKYQPVKPRVIAKQLKVPSEQHKALKLAIKRLVKSGKLVYGSGHIVRKPKPPP